MATTRKLNLILTKLPECQCHSVRLRVRVNSIQLLFTASVEVKETDTFLSKEYYEYVNITYIHIYMETYMKNNIYT